LHCRSLVMHDNWPWTPMEIFSEGAHCTTAHMASSEHELITGVWGRSPSGRAAGRGSGGGTNPLKPKSLKHLHAYRTPYFWTVACIVAGSVAEWWACWTQAQKGPGSNRSRDAVRNSLRQTVHTHCASVFTKKQNW